MLKVENISFEYLKGKEVLKDISFNAQKGDYIAIVGESGCGKSTLLEIIYGLLHIEHGAVYWKNEKLLGPNFYLIPGEDFMKYLPQDFDLMPYITVEENVGKNISALDPNKQNRIDELLEVVDMLPFKKTKVKNLSGGQKQRVAIAKVMAKEPDVLLLDEPFSHIDNFRKNKLRRNLFNYLKSKGIICIVATHDSTDALSFADRLIVIQNGSIAINDHPEVVYNQPESAYVASFFNEINEIAAEIITPDKNDKNTLLFYPDDIEVVEKSDHYAIVVQSYFKGQFYIIEVQFNKQHLFIQHDFSLKSGSKVYLNFKKND